MGSGFAQFVRNHVAGDFRADQQHALPFHFAFQDLDDGFSYVFFGDDVDFHAALLDSLLGGGTDGGDVNTPASKLTPRLAFP